MFHKGEFKKRVIGELASWITRKKKSPAKREALFTLSMMCVLVDLDVTLYVVAVNVSVDNVAIVF